MTGFGESSGLIFALWGINILADSAGQLAFKAAAIGQTDDDDNGFASVLRVLRRPWVWAGISCYLLEFVVWLAFLSLVPLSEGVLLGSINIVVIMLAGRYFFNEWLTPLRVTGILLISLGVALAGAQV